MPIDYKSIRSSCYKNTLTPVNSISITPVAGATNVGTITFQCKDSHGNALSGYRALRIWFSDSQYGAGVAGGAASGTCGISGTDGYLIKEVTTKLVWDVVTDSTGEVILTVTDTNERAVYACVTNPWTGEITTAAVLYG